MTFRCFDERFSNGEVWRADSYYASIAPKPATRAEPELAWEDR